MTNKKCLLIIPNQFYSFHKLIKQGLEAKGYTVTTANDEYPATAIGKIIGKLQLPLVFSKTYDHIVNQVLKDEHFDLTLIVKGRGVSNRLLDRLKLQSDNIVGYNWDSFKYNKGPLKWYKNVSRYYTFDFEDAAKYSIPVLELFSSLPPSQEPKVVKYTFSALFRNHSKRLRYLDKVLSSIKDPSAFTYIYEQNILTFGVNFIKNPALYLRYWKDIHFKPLPYAQYLDALRSSEYTIDYAHTDQSGITMRCYESISMQTKIITNNPLIKKSHYFNDANSIVFELEDAPSSLLENFTMNKEKPFEASYRGLSDFINEITSIDQKQAIESTIYKNIL